jgi:hypothetical protein
MGPLQLSGPLQQQLAGPAEVIQDSYGELGQLQQNAPLQLPGQFQLARLLCLTGADTAS